MLNLFLDHELDERNSEKDHLVAALAKSCDELQESRATRDQEKDVMNAKMRDLQQTIESFKMEREDRLQVRTSNTELATAFNLIYWPFSPSSSFDDLTYVVPEILQV